MSENTLSFDQIVSFTGHLHQAHHGDAGRDLVYTGENPVTLGSLERYLFPTGVHLEFHQDDYVAMVCPRSGLAVKHGLTVANAPGIVDSGYTGEVKVCLVNLSDEQVVVHPGERIAQLVLVPCAPVVGNSVRGDRGFGSTGA